MKKGKMISLVVASAVLMSTNAMAATVYTRGSDADLWSEAVYTEQNRIYGNGTYRQNYEWPGTATLRNASYPGCLLEPGSMSIDEVFGEECQDLLFTDLEKTKDPIAYMEDGDRLLTVYQMTEHNGFLYVLTGGNKTTLTAKSGTDVNGVTQSYNVASRSDTSGADSYLYVFDISRGENYEKSRYARWSIADLGLQDGNALRYMESIAVDDNNIYIGTCNGASVSEAYTRGAAVFKNTVKRGVDAVIPTRIDAATEDYSYGLKPVIGSSLVNTSSYGFYESYLIGGNMVTFFDGSLSLVPSSRKAAAAVWSTPVGNRIDATKVYYLTDWYATESDSAGLSIAGLLKSEITTAWNNAVNPVILDICVDGDELIFLVSYTAGGKNYKEVFVTDWSNPNTPVLADSIVWETTELEGYCYSYDGYIYVSSLSCIDVIKKADYENAELTYNGKLDLNGINTSEKPLYVAVSGDYLYGWMNVNQNTGYELKAKLNSDKTAIVEEVHKNGARRKNDAVVYGGRIYTRWGGEAGVHDAARQSCVFVADTNNMMPVSLWVDKVDAEAVVPYVITGGGQNIDAVKVLLNGQDKGYIKATNDGSGLSKWQYTVTETGENSVEFIGASMEGYPVNETSETVRFKAYGRDNVSMTSAYSVTGSVASVTVNITNGNEIDVKVVPAAGLYSDNAMMSVAFGDEVTVSAGETKTVTLTLNIPEYAADYKVKTFLIGGTDTIVPLTEVVEN